MNNNQHAKRSPTILALSDDPDLVELLLKTCNRPWKVKVTGDLTSCLHLVPDGDCKVVVVDDEKLGQVDRGWLLNRIQNWIPQSVHNLYRCGAQRRCRADGPFARRRLLSLQTAGF